MYRHDSWHELLQFAKDASIFIAKQLRITPNNTTIEMVYSVVIVYVSLYLIDDVHLNETASTLWKVKTMCLCLPE
jgi:hypothetical protein